MGKGRHQDDYALANNERNQPVGIYGWRKRCLYAFILFLMVITVVNLALLIWILRVLNFNLHGMGKVRITDEGVRLESEAEFLKTLYASKIKSKQGHLNVESEREIIMEARDDKGELTNRLYIGNNTMEAVCRSFEVKDTKGETRLKVTEDDIQFVSEEVIFKGNTSAVFEVAVRTPTLRGPHNQPLSISSETKLKLFGQNGVDIKAPNGKLKIESDDDVILQSNDNAIYLDSKNIYIQSPVISNSGSGTAYRGQIYQLCMCQNGKLFLSLPNQDCIGTDDVCL